jgi:hypothetical protein
MPEPDSAPILSHQVLTDPTGRRRRRMAIAGRAAATVLGLWLVVLILGGLGLQPLAGIPIVGDIGARGSAPPGLPRRVKHAAKEATTLPARRGAGAPATTTPGPSRRPAARGPAPAKTRAPANEAPATGPGRANTTPGQAPAIAKPPSTPSRPTNRPTTTAPGQTKTAPGQTKTAPGPPETTPHGNVPGARPR